MTLETGKGGRYPYYNCRRYTREGTCRGQRIPAKIMDTEVLEHLTSKLFSVRRLQFLVGSWLEDVKRKKHHQKHDEKAIRSEIDEEKRKLENIYRAIEKGVVTKENLDERIGEIRRNTHLLEEKLAELRKLRTLALPSHLLSIHSLRHFQRSLKEVFYQDSALAKKYLTLFLDKIQVNGETVRIVARKDILLRAISLKSKDSFIRVPTAGGVWLPEQDSNQTHLVPMCSD